MDEILIYEDIGPWTTSRVIEEINQKPSALIRINSAGGSVFDGITLYNYLEKLNVNTQIDGLAASAASLIFQAGRKRIMASGSQQMIHEVSGAVMGGAGEMRKQADVIEKLNASILAIYKTANKKMDEDTINKMIQEETWMDAETAIEYGFADELTESVRAVASADCSKYAYKNKGQNMSISEKFTAVFKSRTAEMENKLSDLQNKFDAVTKENLELKVKLEELTNEIGEAAIALEESENRRIEEAEKARIAAEEAEKAQIEAAQKTALAEEIISSPTPPAHIEPITDEPLIIENNAHAYATLLALKPKIVAENLRYAERASKAPDATDMISEVVALLKRK